MSKRLAIWIAGLILLVLLVAAGAWLLVPSPRTGTVVIEISAPAAVKFPVKFQGSCDVDGNNRDLSGTAPARFTVEGHKLVFSFTSVDGTEEFNVKADLVGGRESYSAATARPPRGVRGWVQFGGSRSHWAEAFDPKKSEHWVVAPP